MNLLSVIPATKPSALEYGAAITCIAPATESFAAVRDWPINDPPLQLWGIE